MKKLCTLLFLTAALPLLAKLNYLTPKAEFKLLGKEIENILKLNEMESWDISIGLMKTPAVAKTFQTNFPKGKLKDDGYFVVVKGGKVTIGSHYARGVIYGLNALIKKCGGYTLVRPYEVDDKMAVLPKKIKNWKSFSNPVFFSRELHPCAYNLPVPRDTILFGLRNGFNKRRSANQHLDKYGKDLDAYDLQLMPVGSHSFYYWLPGELYKTHPEYFPLVKGKRLKYHRNNYTTQVQLCMGNPEVVKLVASRIIQWKKKNPAAQGVSVGVNDGFGFCECDLCIATDAPGDLDNRRMSTRVFTFLNKVAEIVCKEYPDLYIGTFAYLTTAAPPAVKIHPNIAIELCTYYRCYKCAISDPKCSTNIEWNRKLKVWEKYPNLKVIYDYNTGGVGYPVPYLEVLQKDLQYYVKNNFRGFLMESRGDLTKAKLSPKQLRRIYYRDTLAGYFDEWTGYKMKYHLLGELLWNPYADLNKLKAEYFSKYFGNAGKYYREFYEFNAKRWFADKTPYVWNKYKTNFPEMLFTAKDIPYIRSLMKKAAAAAKKEGNAIYIQRVKDENAYMEKHILKLINSQYILLPIGKRTAVINHLNTRKGRDVVKAAAPSKVEISLKGDKLLVVGTFTGKFDICKPERDGAGDWGCTFELFIRPGKNRPADGYYQFMLSAGGSVYDAQMRNKSWDSSVKYRSVVKNGVWKAYVEIPLKELGYEVVNGEKIRCNFASVRHYPKEISSWTDGSLSAMSSYGILVIEK